MLDNNIMYALGKAIAKYAREIVMEDTSITTNEIIDFAPLLSQWKQGQYEVGDIVIYNNYPYKCIINHDSTGNSLWNPKDAQSLWSNYHGTDSMHALPYVKPSGAYDAYMINEYMIWNDSMIYKSIMDNNVYNPDEYPSGWEFIEEI